MRILNFSSLDIERYTKQASLGQSPWNLINSVGARLLNAKDVPRDENYVTSNCVDQAPRLKPLSNRKVANKAPQGHSVDICKELKRDREGTWV